MMFRLTPILPVLFGVLSAQLSLGIMTPLIPLLLLGHGTATSVIGLVASSYFVGFLLGTLSVHRLVAAVGHIRAFSVFAAIAADAALLLALTHTALLWAVLRGLIGFAMAGLFLVAESWLNARADAATRGRTFGAYLVASWGGSAIGPVALTLVPGNGTLFIWVGIGFATALLPLAMTHQANPKLGDRPRFGPLRLLRISPFGLIVALTAGLVNSAFYSLAPVYLRQSGQPAVMVSVFVSTVMVMGLLVQVPVGLLSDRFGRRQMALAGIALALLLAVALAGGRHLPFATLLGLGALYAGATAPLYGLGAAHTNDSIDPDEIVSAGGGLLFAWALGSSLGPSIAALAMGRIGPAGLFVFLAAVLAAAGLFTIARMQLREQQPGWGSNRFIPTPVAPAGMPELAPRIETPAESAPAPAAPGD